MFWPSFLIFFNSTALIFPGSKEHAFLYFLVFFKINNGTHGLKKPRIY